jgi:uncharacterized protein (DUF1330 family)
MPKAYWVVCYHSIKNPEALAAYAKLAAPAIQAAGGRFLVRTPTPAKTYEAGMQQRTVVTEFESVARAIAAHDSPGYQEALRVLGDAAVRDVRIVEGVA